ncbi:phytanoyl-CoA dioxygenase family protein [Erythrobacter donghaensis]|uniref:phytanoyl-CoA dioxygenase family protein n=1 Tax=Erythrobacter donghaensis TaxID=267135 RepID=UPI00117C24D4|nr:phytanoyl-CoA dioxygenase family protein [Erythrobacter donghaensis]
MAGEVAGGARGLIDLRLDQDGAQLFPGAGTAMLLALKDWYASAPSAPGTRITQLGALGSFLTGSGPIAAVVTQLGGARMRPVRAIAFDKSPQSNWSLGWHQDRTINVAGRAEVEGYGPWTIKQGSPHVQPPFAVIAEMLTLRIHLDAVTPDNAPLQIALGSHRRGYIAESDVAAVVAESPQAACLAQPGDVWAYATPILHASQRSRSTARRRVLQVDFSSADLPVPLEWALRA